ncbi:MAG: methyltransferase domain-containing protein [candidate division NC10 bacterium]
MKEDHREVIKREFGKQAPRFGDRSHTVASPAYLEWMVKNLDLEPHFAVLDVAAGTGLLGRAIAPYVKQVVALDATPEMLLEGGRQAEQAGIENIALEHGLAEDLPYPNDAFDMVVSRFAMHHFEDPRPPMNQMVRVCRPGGKVAVIDLVSPDDATVATAYNRLERLRDPSHTRALSATELSRLLRDGGLDIVHTVSREVEVRVDRWFELTEPEREVRRTIVEELTQDVKGLRMTGMRPFLHGDELMFLQTWVIVVGVKCGEPESIP